MKGRIPFLLGLVLGPVGVILALIVYGRRTVRDSLKGLGAFVCVVLFGRIVELESSRSHERGTENCDGGVSMSVEAKTSKTLDQIARENRHVTGVGLDVLSEQAMQYSDGGDAKIKEVHEKLSRLKAMVKEFRDANNGCFPKSLLQLSQARGKNCNMPYRDAWGRRFSDKVNEGNFSIVSAGPDRRFDTDDDIAVTVRGRADKNY